MSDELAEPFPQLRCRAEELKQRFDQLPKPERKPVFIEFSGTPKSGKSTCIDITAHFFKRTGFSVLSPAEGASKRTPYFLKDDLVAFNAWSASYALTQVLEGMYGTDSYDLVILDRGLFDALVWFELLESEGQIGETERDAVHAFLLVEKWRAAIDAVFLFRSDARTSLERENRDKLISEPGRAMNAEFLERLNEAYERARERYESSFRYLTVVDTGSASSSPRETAANVVEQILEIAAP